MAAHQPSGHLIPFARVGSCVINKPDFTDSRRNRDPEFPRRRPAKDKGTTRHSTWRAGLPWYIIVNLAPRHAQLSRPSLPRDEEPQRLIWPTIQSLTVEPWQPPSRPSMPISQSRLDSAPILGAVSVSLASHLTSHRRFCIAPRVAPVAGCVPAARPRFPPAPRAQLARCGQQGGHAIPKVEKAR